jgi:hypothetical protein
MANYAVNNSLAGTPQNMSTSYKTLVVVTASNATQLRRGQIYDVLIGTDGSPADNAMVFDISRQTAAGTATSVTPVALNPADAAMLGVAAANATVEGTITSASSVFNIGLNQRASYRWVAAPGSELVYPATNANGFALRAKSPAYTSTATGEVLVTEL